MLSRVRLLMLVSLVLVLGLMAGCVAPVADAPADDAAADADSEETAAETPEELTPIDFRLNWTLYGEHAPFFVAVDKGFYADEGLDVTILEGSGSGTTVKLVGNGEHELGYADSGTMMRAVNAGVPVKAVAVFLQKSPMSVIFKAENPISSAEELVGKSIAITAGDANSQIFPAVLAKNGIGEDDVSMVVVASPGAKEVTLLEDQVDAFLGYFIDQPARMEARTGQEMAWTTYADMGVNALSSAIITNEKTLENNPELVEKFVAATVRAVEYTMENPEEAAEIFALHAEEFDKDLALMEIEGSLSLLHSEYTEGMTPGLTAIEDWQATQDILSQYAELEPADDVNIYFTNDFIPSGE